MEDQKRGMAAAKGELPPIRETHSNESRFTVMIMRSVGGVRSFKVSPHLLFWAALFFCAYMVVSLLAINRYVALRRTVALQGEELRQMDKEAVRDKKRLHRFRQHIALLEDYIRNPEKLAQKGERDAAQPETAGAEKVSPEKEMGAQAVAVKDLVIQRNGARMSVDFKLVNLNQGEGAAGGYVHVMALDKGSEPPREWVYPREKLEKGLPADYRRGQPFLIQRFKPMKARFELDTQAPLTIRVLVHDQSGTLILEKESEG